VSRPSARRAELLEQLDRQARRTGSVGTMHSRAIAGAAGLHSSDYECIDVLDWTGPITAGELARRVGLTSGAITGVLDRLERGNWVRRASDPRDRRRVVVELLPPPIADPSHPVLQGFARLAQEIAEINEDYTDDQLAAIVSWLTRANDAVERNTLRLRGQEP
jgi:DNA-binding MarR family transcriptional regulator